AACTLVPTRALRHRSGASGPDGARNDISTIWIAVPTTNEANGSPPGSAYYTAHETIVKLGISDNDRTQIKDGVSRGDRVIVSGQDYLKEGDRVTQVEARQ